MPRDPYAEHGTEDEPLSVFCCPFCESFEASDLLIDPMGALKGHVLAEHPVDYHAVMNAVDAAFAERDRFAKQLALEAAVGDLAGRRN